MRVVYAVFLLLASTLPAQTTQPSPLAPAFNPILFLLGTWTAKTSAAGSAQAQAAGEYTFHTDLDGTVITRTTTADTCVAPQSFLCQHHDLLTIFREPTSAALQALYLDSEGHTIHYTLSFPSADTVVFLSNTPGPQFRLAYHLSKGIMSGRFQFAPPGSQAFKSYLDWSGGHAAAKTPTASDKDHPMSSSIAALRDSSRILLVFAPTSSDVLLRTQMADFKSHERSALDRNLILVPVLGKWTSEDAILYDRNLPFSIDKEQEYARTRFKIAPNRFAVILLGLDGGEKLRSRTPVQATTLFQTIDAMPMRQQEIRTRGKELKSQ